MRLQELAGQSDKLSFSASVLHGPIEYHVIGYQGLPLLAVGIER